MCWIKCKQETYFYSSQIFQFFITFYSVRRLYGQNKKLFYRPIEMKKILRGLGVYQKMLTNLTRKIVQLKSLKMPRNT